MHNNHEVAHEIKIDIGPIAASCAYHTQMNCHYLCMKFQSKKALDLKYKINADLSMARKFICKCFA